GDIAGLPLMLVVVAGVVLLRPKRRLSSPRRFSGSWAGSGVGVAVAPFGLPRSPDILRSLSVSLSRGVSGVRAFTEGNSGSFCRGLALGGPESFGISCGVAGALPALEESLR